MRLLTRSEARDNLELIELLIGLASRLAATSLKKKKAGKRFSEALDELLAFEDRPDSLEFLRARNRFYRMPARNRSGNGELPRILPGMEVHLLRVQFRSFYPVPQKAGISDYRRIGEAVLAGDAKRAELAGQAHVRRIAKEVDRSPRTMRLVFRRDEEASEAWAATSNSDLSVERYPCGVLPISSTIVE